MAYVAGGNSCRAARPPGGGIRIYIRISAPGISRRLTLIYMKKIVAITAFVFVFIPSVSFAAALTQQQSTSLIAVVQSSPGTPASAFVSLITAFSNITVNQAASLITVVQAAPGVPANAFVNLLTSFTVDTPITQSATPATNQAVTPTTPSGTIPPAPNQSATPSTVQVSPVSVSFRSSPTNVPAGSIRRELAVFNMLANENVKVTDLYICVINPTHNNGLHDGSIRVNGVGIGTFQRIADCDTTPAGTKFDYGSQFILTAGVMSSVTVVGDTEPSTSGNETVQIKLVGQGSRANAVPGNDVLGGVVSVVDTTLTAVQEHSCPSIQSNLGTQSACLGSFKLYSTREEISINTITINITAANASLITNLTLKDHVTGAALYHVSGTALAVKATPTTKNTYPVNFKVPTSGKTIDVYGNVPSNAGAIQLTLDSPTDGVGVSTGWSSSIASPIPLQTITIQQIPTPTLSCTQDTWSCSDWLGCSSSGSQIRTCNKTFDCSSVATPSPTTSQSCTPPTVTQTPVPTPTPSAVVYSDYNFNYQWTPWIGSGSTLSCPVTPRNIVIKKAVFKIFDSELQKITTLQALEADGFKIIIQPLSTFHARRSNLSLSGTYSLEEMSPNTFVYFGGDIPICGDGGVVSISDVQGSFMDIVDGRNVKIYLAQKGVTMDVESIANGVSFYLLVSPIMAEWEVWDYTTNKPVRIP